MPSPLRLTCTQLQEEPLVLCPRLERPDHDDRCDCGPSGLVPQSVADAHAEFEREAVAATTRRNLAAAERALRVVGIEPGGVR